MRFAFSSNAFKRYTIIEAIKIIAQLGYSGIEIMADVPHAFPLHLTDSKIREIRAALNDYNLEISNINAFMHHADGDTYHPSWIERDPKLRAKRVDYTLRCIDLANQLGATHISTEPGGPLEDMDREDGMRYYFDGLMQIAESATIHNVKILIEPEPGLLIENSRQFLDLMTRLDKNTFGLNFDIGHFYCVGEDPKKLIQELRTYAHHFHLEDIAESRVHHHLLLGEGAIDIIPILEAIVRSEFNGFVTVELYTYEDDPIRAARLSMEYLKAWNQGS